MRKIELGYKIRPAYQVACILVQLAGLYCSLFGLMKTADWLVGESRWILVQGVRLRIGSGKWKRPRIESWLGRDGFLRNIPRFLDGTS